MLQRCWTGRRITVEDPKSRKALPPVDDILFRPVLLLSLVVLAAAPPPPAVNLPAAATVFAAGQDTVAQNLAGKVEVELTRALKKKGVFLVELGALYPPPKPPSSEEGDKLFTEGREAYDNLDFEAAGKALANAAVFFIKHPAAAKPEQLSEIFLFLGASELQNGAKAAALKEFARALQMNPALAPDNKYFGADVQTAFSAAQKEMGKRAKGVLSVESIPSGAEVEAFGLNYGLSPTSEIELPAGRYMVRLSRPGFAPATAFPEVIGGQTVDVRQKLEAAPEIFALHDKADKVIGRIPFEAEALPPVALELARAANGRFLIMVAVTTDSKMMPKIDLQVWNVNSGDRLKGVKFDADADGNGYQTGAEAISAWISRPGPVVAVTEKDDSVQLSTSEPVFKKWWFWTAVGVVAVGGVSAGIVVAQPKGSRGFNPALGNP